MAKAKFSPAYKRLRELLIAARKAAGLHQTDVAKKLGVHQSFISKVESGERRLDVVELLRIAEILKADPLDLIQSVAKISESTGKRQ